MSIIVKKLLKNESVLNMDFGRTFENLPVVIASPFWEGSSRGVDHVTTVTAITKTNCTIISDNRAAAGYFVNVLVVDPLEARKVGRLKYYGGWVNKATPEIDIAYPSNRNLRSSKPATLLTPFWDGGNQQVAHSETVDDNSGNGISLVSDNQAANYFVNHFAIELGKAFPKRKGLGRHEAGVVNKVAMGKVRVYFSQRFTEPPMVNVTSWWDGQHAGVKKMETIVTITSDYFEIVSDNHANNYFVSWIAIQPL